MMSDIWQNLIIILAVLGAAAYLTHSFVRWRRRQNACGNCKLREMAGEDDRAPTDSRATD